MHLCSHPMHSFSTSTILVQLRRMTPIFGAIVNIFSCREIKCVENECRWA